MFDKILTKLKEQRGKNSSVSDRSLEDLARSYEAFITTDEQLEKADFTGAIKSIDGNLRHFASEALKTKEKEAEIEKLRKQKEEEDKKKEEEEQKRKQEMGKEEVPEWMRTYMKTQEEALKARDSQIDKLMQGIEGINKEKVTKSRTEQLNTVLKDLPELVKTPILLGYKNTSFQSDESFKEYLEGIENTTKDYIEKARQNGIMIPMPKGEQKKQTKEEKGQTPELASALEMVKKKKQEEEKASIN